MFGHLMTSNPLRTSQTYPSYLNVISSFHSQIITFPAPRPSKREQGTQTTMAMMAVAPSSATTAPSTSVHSLPSLNLKLRTPSGKTYRRRQAVAVSALKTCETQVAPPKMAPEMAMGAAFMAATGTWADSASAAQEVAQLAASDNRGSLLLLVLTPAIGWVLFNILRPALNQLNRMRSAKSVLLWAGLGGAAAGVFSPYAEDAKAQQALFDLAAEGSSDGRGGLIFLVLAPAVGWVLFNILQPALNQLNRMRSN